MVIRVGNLNGQNPSSLIELVALFVFGFCHAISLLFMISECNFTAFENGVMFMICS